MSADLLSAMSHGRLSPHSVGLHLLLWFGSGSASAPVGRTVQSTANHQQILYTFEYDNHPHDWELVPYQNVSAGPVRWMMGLKDRLTVSREVPLGQDLTVCLLPLYSEFPASFGTDHLCLMQLPAQWWVPAYGQGVDRGSDSSLYDVIQAQLATDTEFLYLPKLLLILYQLTL